MRTLSRLICRVQDVEGRGPYRPGFSHRWTDKEGPDTPPWWVEIGEPVDVAHARMTDKSMHYGCGFDSLAQMHRWFTARELRALDRLGFKLVKIAPDIIIAETERQVVFGARRPLSEATPRISLLSSIARAA